jgi:general secretion pathway protein D
MILPIHLRVALSSRWLRMFALCCLACPATRRVTSAQTPATGAQTAAGQAQQTPPDPAQAVPAKPDEGQGTGTAIGTAGAHAVESTPGKRQLQEAENAYLAGAKKLEHDDLNAAERDFAHALKLDPENGNYAIAISVTRQHRLTELVQQASKARQAGDQEKAEALLAEARAMDPLNPIVVEHSGPFVVSSASGSKPVSADSGQGTPAKEAGAEPTNPLANRTQMLLGTQANEAWRIEAPALAGAIRLAPADMVKSFHTRGESRDVLREVALAYGIRTIVDDSVERKTLRFDLEDVSYQQAMSAAMSMAHVFAVPVDETSVILAKDDTPSHQRLERQLEETIFLPGSTTEQINELANVVRTVFNVKQATVQGTLGNIVVRAPEDVLEPMNRALQGLIESPGEVMVEVKMYEVDATRMTNAGATLPNQAGIFNVAQAAASLVSANQSLVQQAIAQGLISATASNFEIAAALLASGLVQSSLLSSTIGVFGKGLTQTGITETGSVAFNLGLNTSDTRALDDVQIRVGDRQPAIFREGTRYPITTSTYSSGLSTAASSLSNASINGVSVASLLSQFAGGTSTTIPQVSYEDLGVTLKATPVIQNSGRVSLLLDLKIEALGGSSANGIPVLENRQFASDLTVADGESVLMVSSVTRSETAAMTGIPGLSELPGFQMPLQDTVEKDSSQFVVVVTPHIVRRRTDLVAGPRIPVRASE